MYIIAGLGNPTSRYDKTRHNVGFEVIDCLAKKYGIDVDTKKHKALIGKGMIASEKVLLVKPQTFMNLSGESIREITDYYKADESDLIVIYDDISLNVGQIRIRAKGSAGGHNGIKNIIQHMGTQNFWRIKVGIGEKPAHRDLADYVLGHFQGEEKEIMQEAFANAADAAAVMISEGIDTAMNRFNRVK
ncbi:MAG: aminoacyl-tRNA hydrolase [Clostridiales bacterium]|nr:aminoacyl-tRNA hydrolase [Clostridiales bacterium]